MSTRHSARAPRPTLKAIESSSVSPPTTKPARTRPSKNQDDIVAEDEPPVAKRRKISPESQDSAANGRGIRSNSRKDVNQDDYDEEEQEEAQEEEDQEETPRQNRRPGRRAAAVAATTITNTAKARTRKKAQPPPSDSEKASITLDTSKVSKPPQIKLTGATPQKIPNLYGGRRKHVDRDDTPGSTVSSRAGGAMSPTKSARKPQSKQQDATGDEDELGSTAGAAPTAVDKFKRGRHGAVKKKVSLQGMKPTVVVNGIGYDEDIQIQQGTPASSKRGRGRKAKGDDTDLEGDIIMADSDARRKKKVTDTVTKKDDESSIYDFPESDEEEDPFKGKTKEIKKVPSRFAAGLRRAQLAAQEGEISSSSRGNEAGDEKEDELEVGVEKDMVEAPKQPRAQTKFTGKVTDDAVKYLKKTVMTKITRRGLPEKVVGLTDEYNTVLNLIEQTVVAGEGNSILLIGPRGSGKSLVAEKAIKELQKHHEKDFIVVRLSGCLQTDEKTAVKEIWRQLGSSMELDESKPINFADTLTTILALLSHPSEHDPNASQEQMAETTSISVIFLLSEFEQFAAHPRQTLLYNLFDIAQARKAPIAVVGMTSKINIVEDLEKRVKSRFSHRTLGFRIGGNLGSRLEGWWEIARAGLCVDIDALPIDVGKTEFAYYNQWNANLDDAFKNDKAFRRTVEGVYTTSKSVQALYNNFMVSICKLSATMPFLGTGAALLKDALVAPDNKLYLLEDLPELSLSMLIAAARLDPILETDTCNFTMAYDEYKTLVSRVKIYSQTTWGLKLWGKDVALAAWEKLAEWELIVPVVGAAGHSGGIGVTASLLVGSGNAGVGRRESRMFRVDVGLMEIKKQGRAWGMSSILQGWCTI
ncbi:hypothetical protein ABW20_dc0104169 [Dactylellina cionopaga]|nr:hypothetical protein ABW20_dc0104169 [Dactylellina cionopaga]